MSYTSIIKLEGETDIKVCFNPEPKPKKTVLNSYSGHIEHWQSYDLRFKEWDKNHQYISFYSKHELQKTICYLQDERKLGAYKEKVENQLKEGVEVDCIEIKNIADPIGQSMCKSAFFKQPKETKVSEERLYTKDEVIGFIKFKQENVYGNFLYMDLESQLNYYLNTIDKLTKL